MLKGFLGALLVIFLLSSPVWSSVDFDAADYRISVSNVNIGTVGTFAFWVLFDGETTSDYIMDSSGGRYLFYETGGAPIDFGWYLNGTAVFDPALDDFLTIGAWTHVALVFDN